MIRKHFETRAELERQIDAARQLRVETLAGAGWIFSAFSGVMGAIRRMLPRIASHQPRKA